jgi:Meiotically up-regulated gene 113
MDNVVFFIAGAAIAGLPLLIWFYGNIALIKSEKRSLKDKKNQLKSDADYLAMLSDELGNKKRQFDNDLQEFENKKQQIIHEYEDKTVQLLHDFENKKRQLNDDYETRTIQLKNQQQRIIDDYEHKSVQITYDFENKKRKLNDEFEKRIIKYDELLIENNNLKHDLFNLSVQLNKLDRDHAVITKHQEELNQKTNQLAHRYLVDNVSWIGNKLTSNNFITSKNRLLEVIKRCREIGFEILEDKEAEYVEELKKKYEQAVRDEFAREEQARIKAQIREEEKFEREKAKKMQEAERELALINAALEKALKEAKDEHSAEVDYWKAKASEAEENKRAISNAQMTKSGTVYVISNIGSFGDNVFKIGMTRRDEPLDRIYELSSSSVPFPFDVHMMIYCDDAPSIENAIHRDLFKMRVNKVKRKEFFHVDIDTIKNLETIRKIAEADPKKFREFEINQEEQEYWQSLHGSEEDFEFIEQTAESVMGQE